MSPGSKLYLIEDPDDGQQLEVGTHTAGVIDYHGDSDWFVLTLAEGETVVLYTDAIATDTAIAIGPRGTGFEDLAFDDDSGSALCAQPHRMALRVVYRSGFMRVM